MNDRPDLDPGAIPPEMPPVIDLYSDQEKAGGPLPPLVELIPCGPPRPAGPAAGGRAGDRRGPGVDGG